MKKKNLLYIGLGVAAIAAYFIFKGKKTGTSKFDEVTPGDIQPDLSRQDSEEQGEQTTTETIPQKSSVQVATETVQTAVNVIRRTPEQKAAAAERRKQAKAKRVASAAKRKAKRAGAKEKRAARRAKRKAQQQVGEIYVI